MKKYASSSRLAILAVALFGSCSSFAQDFVIEIPPDLIAVSYHEINLATLSGNGLTTSEISEIARAQAKLECLAQGYSDVVEETHQLRLAREGKIRGSKVIQEAGRSRVVPGDYYWRDRPYQDSENPGMEQEYYFTQIKCTDTPNVDLAALLSGAHDSATSSQAGCQSTSASSKDATGSIEIPPHVPALCASHVIEESSLRSSLCSRLTSFVSSSTRKFLRQTINTGIVGAASSSFAERLFAADLGQLTTSKRALAMNLLKLTAVDMAIGATGNIYRYLTNRHEENRSLADLIDLGYRSLDENSQLYQEDQIKKLRKTLNEATLKLAAFAQKKSKDKLSEKAKTVLNALHDNTWKKLTINDLRETLDSIRSYSPTLADVEATAELKDSFQRIFRILSFPLQPKKLNVDEVYQNCKEVLKKRPPQFKEQLEGMALGLASGSHSPDFKRDFYYLYGEPGNGKTSGVQDLAACVGVPLCVIDADKIRNPLPPHILEKLRTPVAGETRSRLADLTKQFQYQVLQCMEKFVDSTGNPMNNGIIIVDDLDRILNNEFKPVSTGYNGVKEFPPERAEFFDFLKKLADSSHSTIDDFETGYAVSIKNATFFVTGNSIPRELKRDSAFMSRGTAISVQYPRKIERENYINSEFKNFIAASLPTLDQESVYKACQPTLDEILRFDLLQGERFGGRFGMRGLERLLKSYFGFILNKVRSASTTDLLCSGFDVSANGFSHQDYLKEISNELLEQDFETEIHKFRYEYDSQIKKIQSPQVRIFINKQFQVALGLNEDNTALSLDQRKEVFEQCKSVIQFATDRKSISEEEKKDLSALFSKRFSFLKKSSHRKNENTTEVDRFKSVTAIANTVIDKILARPNSDPQEKGSKEKKEAQPEILNRIVLAEKENEFSDLGVIHSLADFFGVPICEITKKKHLVKINEPAWKKHQTTNVGSYLNVTTGDASIQVSLEWDAVRKVYFTRNNYNGVNGPLIYDPDKKKAISIPAAALAEEERTDSAWMQYCSTQWKNSHYPGQGFVIFSIPELSNEEVTELTEQIFTDVNQAGHSQGKDSSVRDLTQMTAFIVPSTGELSRKIAQGSMKNKVIQLPLNTLSLDSRKRLATAMLDEALTNLKSTFRNPPEKIELNPSEQRLFKLIVQWDQTQAESVKGQIKVDALRAGIDALVDEVRIRHEDHLGLQESRLEVGPFARRLETLYKPFLPTELAENLGKRREAVLTASTHSPEIIAKGKSERTPFIREVGQTLMKTDRPKGSQSFAGSATQILDRRLPGHQEVSFSQRPIPQPKARFGMSSKARPLALEDMPPHLVPDASEKGAPAEFWRKVNRGLIEERAKQIIASRNKNLSQELSTQRLTEEKKSKELQEMDLQVREAEDLTRQLQSTTQRTQSLIVSAEDNLSFWTEKLAKNTGKDREEEEEKASVIERIANYSKIISENREKIMELELKKNTAEQALSALRDKKSKVELDMRRIGSARSELEKRVKMSEQDLAKLSQEASLEKGRIILEIKRDLKTRKDKREKPK